MTVRYIDVLKSSHNIYNNYSLSTKACNVSREQILFNLYKEISLYYGMRIVNNYSLKWR